MNAQEAWNAGSAKGNEILLRYLGASRKVAAELSNRSWAALSRWAKNAIKKLIKNAEKGGF